MKKIFILSVFLIVGCGKYDRLDDGGFTKVTFFSGPRNLGSDPRLASALPGGIMIYAYSPSYVTNVKLVDETDNVTEIILPNGSYSFYAFGYSSATNPTSSPLKCGVVGASSPITLDGTPRTVDVTVTDIGCADGAFVNDTPNSFTEGTLASTAVRYNFARVMFMYCSNGANTAISGFTNTDTCGASNTMYRWMTGSMGFKAKFPIYKKQGGQYVKLGNGISGGCSVIDTVGENYSSVFTSLQRLPMGNSAREGLFALEVEAYSSTDCTTPLLVTHEFRRGLIFGPDGNSPSTLNKILPYTNGGVSANAPLYFLIAN